MAEKTCPSTNAEAGRLEKICAAFSKRTAEMKRMIELRQRERVQVPYSKVMKEVPALSCVLDEIEVDITEQEKLKDSLKERQKAAESYRDMAAHFHENIPPNLPEGTRSCTSKTTVKPEEQPRYPEEPKGAKGKLETLKEPHSVEETFPVTPQELDSVPGPSKTTVKPEEQPRYPEEPRGVKRKWKTVKERRSVPKKACRSPEELDSVPGTSKTPVKPEEQRRYPQKPKGAKGKLETVKERRSEETSPVTPQDPTSVPGTSQTTEKHEEQPTVSQELKGAKKAQRKGPPCVKEMASITPEEFDSVPGYMRGRLRCHQINEVVEAINKAVVSKYRIFHQPLRSANRGLRCCYRRFWEEETKETKGCFFIVDEDIRDFTTRKVDKQFHRILTILRHCHRLKYVRDAKAVRYVIC